VEQSNDFLDEARDSTLVENTAQAVFKHLDRLEDHRIAFGSKWVWELLQNARDAALPDGVSIEIVLADDRLDFRHSGAPFKPSEIAHLIYHGSTKVDADRDLDHFGSGFLSTHLLSRVVRVRGALEDGRAFEFNLDRSGATIDHLREAMDRSWNEFKESIASGQRRAGWSTEYVFPLTPEALVFAGDGLASLRSVGHLALAFSPEFRGVDIRTESSRWTFARGDHERLTDEIEMLRVECRVDGRSVLRRMAIAGNPDDVEAVLPLAELDDGLSADLEEETPRLFIVFPLVTTERLPFPAVVNSKRFKPREDRDGIVLAGDTERIAENKDLLERAAKLILRLLAYGAEAHWHGLEKLLGYDSNNLPDWIDRDWFTEYIRHLIAETRLLPLLTTPDGRWIAPADAWIPTENETSCRQTLWTLCSAWVGAATRLPKSQDAERWSRNLNSWRLLYREELPETFTIGRLTELVHDAATVDGLRVALVSEEDPLNWLKSLHAVIHEAGSTALLDQQNLLPSQAGTLRRRTELRYDGGIDEEFKDIAQQFKVTLRSELLDARAATSEVIGLLTPMSEEQAVDAALDALIRICSGDGLSSELARPNAALFWWLARRPAHHHRVDNYPLVTADETGGLVRTISLIRGRDRAPLASASVWPATARAFATLFPRRKVLHDVVAATDAGATNEGWAELETDGYVRIAPLFRTTRTLQRFLAESGLQERDDESHRSTDEVDVSDIAFLTEEDIGLVDTARKSRTRAVQLLEFVVRSVMHEDGSAFEKPSVPCECGQNHSAYRAAWLVPLHDRKWIPTGEGRSTVVSAESLAVLVAEQPDVAALLGGGEGAQFLEALGISAADFQLRAIATKESDRLRLVRSMSELARAAGGDIDRVEMLATELHDHPEIIDEIERGRERRAKVQANQVLGRLVEDLLKEVLGTHGLTVRRTGIGSDFEVETDFTDGGQEVLIEIKDGRRSVLIEVKSARSGRVRMTPTQAIKANQEQGGFALCVVPLRDDSPTIDVLRDACRFVFEIGRLLDRPLHDYRSVVEAADGARLQDGQIDVEIAEGQVRFAVNERVWLAGLDLNAAVAVITAKGPRQTSAR